MDKVKKHQFCYTRMEKWQNVAGMISNKWCYSHRTQEETSMELCTSVRVSGSMLMARCLAYVCYQISDSPFKQLPQDLLCVLIMHQCNLIIHKPIAMYGKSVGLSNFI